MPDTYLSGGSRHTRTQNTNALATEWVVVSFWQPKSGSAEGSYSHETFTDQREAEEVFREYQQGAWAKASAVCIFASRHGVPIGRIA